MAGETSGILMTRGEQCTSIMYIYVQGVSYREDGIILAGDDWRYLRRGELYMYESVYISVYSWVAS